MGGEGSKFPKYIGFVLKGLKEFVTSGVTRGLCLGLHCNLKLLLLAEAPTPSSLHTVGYWPPWPALVGDHLALTLPVQALVPLTPPSPSQCALSHSLQLAHGGEGTQAPFLWHTGVGAQAALSGRPLIYHLRCRAFGPHFFW